jgi:outer membrane protein OmpA-like peptidoglycan-associated protein
MRTRFHWPMFFLLLAFIAGSTWYYDCVLKQLCSKPRSSQVNISALPLSFQRSSATPMVAESFAAVKTELIQNAPSDQALEITGLYFADETSDARFDLGTQRALAVMKEFESTLPIERIKTTSRKRDQAAPTLAPFAAAEFRWVALSAPVPVLRPANPLSFNPGSAEAIRGANFPEFQAALGQGSPGQSFEITGTWYQSEPHASGLDLGLQRAAAAGQALGIGTDRLALISRMLAGAAPAGPFEATQFRWIGTPIVNTPTPAPAQSTPVLQVNFASNSAALLPAPAWQRDIAAFVAAAAGKSVRVTGHADSSGRAQKNSRLSRARAQALADALRSAGFTGKLELDAKSADEPAASNSEAAGKQQNRRAVARIE